MKKLFNLHNFFITVPGYFWFWTVFVKPSEVSTFFFFRENLETVFTEIRWYSWVKIWSKNSKWMVSLETRTYFLFFSWRYSLKLGQKNGGIHVLVWSQNLKTCGGIHRNRGYFGEVGGLRPPTSLKTPGFTETTTGFKFLLQTNTWNRHFLSEF